MAYISAYLFFNGNCREAMTFYQQCLGGELTMQSFGESPMAAQTPEELQKNILHSRLVHPNFVLFASDTTDPQGASQGQRVSLCLNCDSEEEIHTLYNKLVEGSTIGHPLKKEFWGGTFGDLTDKFGINWMFSFDQQS